MTRDKHTLAVLRDVAQSGEQVHLSPSGTYVAAARIAELEAALRQYQSAVALCLSEGGVISGEATPWWDAIIKAQQIGAAALDGSAKQ